MKCVRFIIAVSLLSLAAGLPRLQAQATADESSLYYYRIFFTDKGAIPESVAPEQILSSAAIARREKYGIPFPDEADLPVSNQYISVVEQHGLTFRCASKWMNTAVFTSLSPVNSAELEQLSFIEGIRLVKHPADPVKKSYSKYGITQPADDPGAFDPRIPHNGKILHESGFTGREVTIAVLDAGFDKADLIESLTHLVKRGGITATRDFVSGSANVYGYHYHGTAVLSILAGDLPGIIRGTAPGADYILLRTEDDETEYPVEEDYWAAGAEFADSAGADIITSSLGYFTFDDPAMDYSFGDMDGNTAFITRAADIAASKGILVVNSAGNERNKDWLRIIAPSDGDSVLGVGAVRQDLTISDFSSAGFSSDGQVKPDVVAPGVLLPMQFEPGMWNKGSGTSFSCPVISGLSASLMQAVPEASPSEIIDALHRSSDRYNNPDSLYGYGLPDFLRALGYLEEIHTVRPEEIITAGPNPFFDDINMWFHDAPGYLEVTVTSGNGATVIRNRYPAYVARSYRLEGFGDMSPGVYIIRVETDLGARTFKMIRLRR